ncbi:hypothetical protein L6164_010148 [Bauhinia variegata]|uniref:Uncharacterized protein n=1 Tax=Bauhinia variegata TaxID=167791 RepID=A0ACB9PM16_BAUVA|nr:hypothetical protein L6164_010148 [Bauhinia variegata]
MLEVVEFAQNLYKFTMSDVNTLCFADETLAISSSGSHDSFTFCKGKAKDLRFNFTCGLLQLHDYFFYSAALVKSKSIPDHTTLVSMHMIW